MAGQRSNTYPDAAIAVLEDVGHPMSTQQLLEEAIRRDLVQSTGDGQGASFKTALYSHVKRHPDSKIVKLSEKGPTGKRNGSIEFGLRDWNAVAKEASTPPLETKVGVDLDVRRRAIQAALESVKQFVARPDSPKISEADTKANFIDPVLVGLGWAGIEFVVREYYLKNSREFIDYVMRDKGSPLMAVEAKA
jgi:hypothetical protein